MFLFVVTPIHDFERLTSKESVPKGFEPFKEGYIILAEMFFCLRFQWQLGYGDIITLPKDNVSCSRIPLKTFFYRLRMAIFILCSCLILDGHILIKLFSLLSLPVLISS